jgi:hypothetical protein
MDNVLKAGITESRGYLRDLEMTPRKLCTIQVRNEYGVTRMYPMNDVGKKFAGLMGKKTLSDNDLEFLVYLGVNVSEVKQSKW